MTWRQATRALVVGTVLVWAGYDLVCWANGRGDQMLSPAILALSREEPVVTLAAGLLAGHLVWPQTVERPCS